MIESLESRRMLSSSSSLEPVEFQPVYPDTPQTASTLRRTFLSRSDITRDVPDIWTAPNDQATDLVMAARR